MALDPLLIVVLAAIGAGMGFATCFVGLRPLVELLSWTLLFLAVAFMVEVNDLDDFLSFVVGSTLAGLLTGSVQTLFLGAYRKNNPWYAEKAPQNAVQAAQVFVPFATVVGTVFGAAVAGLVWGIFALFD